MQHKKFIFNVFLIVFCFVFLLNILYTQTDKSSGIVEIANYVAPPKVVTNLADKTKQQCDISQIHRTSKRSVKSESSSFINILENLPFPDILGKNQSEMCFEELQMHVADTIRDLLPYLIAEPTHQINSSCFPPPIENISCRNNISARNAESLPKIGVIFQLGFDVDSLEIHLNELWDIVDKFFILESTKSHFGAVRKPLIWERVRDQSRFYKFSAKIVHFVVDDAESAFVAQNISQPIIQVIGKTRKKIKINWGIENLQEKKMYEKFIEWNNSTQFFGDDDFIGFGDVDEVPARSSIVEILNCQIPKDPIDIGIWFPLGRINQAFRTDFPVRDRSHKYKYSLGDPTYWKLSTAKNLYNGGKKYPTRQRGKSPAFILGGIHLSQYGYLPFQIVKRLTQTESTREDLINVFKTIKETLDSGNILKLEEHFAAIPSVFTKRLVPLDKLREQGNERIDEIAILPWYYDCNRERYPMWEGMHDTRID